MRTRGRIQIHETSMKVRPLCWRCRFFSLSRTIRSSNGKFC